MNIFHKIAIIHHINKNKDKITYSSRYDIGNSTRTHNLEIRNKGLVSLQMDRDYWGNTSFCLEYNLRGANRYIIRPCQQSFFDTHFIGRMYDKMLNYYVAKNGTPINQSR